MINNAPFWGILHHNMANATLAINKLSISDTALLTLYSIKTLRGFDVWLNNKHYIVLSVVAAAMR